MQEPFLGRARSTSARYSSRVRVLAVLLTCVAAAVIGGDAALQPARIPSGTASISGRVIDADSERPLEHVLVTLYLTQSAAALATLTDASGRYVFEGLAADEYRLTASFDGYATQGYGKPEVHLREEHVRVAAGQAARDIDFSLRRGGSISGRITRPDGQPIRDPSVMAMQTSPDGGASVSSSTPARTDAGGEVAAVLADQGKQIDPLERDRVDVAALRRR